MGWSKIGAGRRCAECGFTSNAASAHDRVKSIKRHCEKYGHHEAR